MSSSEATPLESFRFCNTNALKSFLSARKKSFDGTFDELEGWYLAVLVYSKSRSSRNLSPKIHFLNKSFHMVFIKTYKIAQNSVFRFLTRILAGNHVHLNNFAFCVDHNNLVSIFNFHWNNHGRHIDAPYQLHITIK